MRKARDNRLVSAYAADRDVRDSTLIGIFIGFLLGWAIFGLDWTGLPL